MIDCVIRGGIVADGTGTPLRSADIGIDGGRIVKVGLVDDSARRVVRADDLVIAPGVVDIHTHYDAQLFWDAAATPSSLHGVTTVIGGNCGFSIAPLEPSQAAYLASMLARVEGMPLESLRQGVPWDWHSFADYLDALEGRIAVNAGFLVGHTTIRRAVMGADDERTASAEELARLEDLLGRSLAAGGLGFSSSLATSHNDAEGRAVSSRYADRHEILRLCTVTGEHEGTTVEFIPSIGNFFSDDDMDLMTSMSVQADRPVNWNVLNVNTTLRDGAVQRLSAAGHAAGRGGRVVALAMPISSTLRLNFVSGFVLDTFPGWSELFELSAADRLLQLADPHCRAR